MIYKTLCRILSSDINFFCVSIIKTVNANVIKSVLVEKDERTAGSADAASTSSSGGAAGRVGSNEGNNASFSLNVIDDYFK